LPLTSTVPPWILDRDLAVPDRGGSSRPDFDKSSPP
jgi:hypothetical protein